MEEVVADVADDAKCKLGGGDAIMEEDDQGNQKESRVEFDKSPLILSETPTNDNVFQPVDDVASIPCSNSIRRFGMSESENRVSISSSCSSSRKSKLRLCVEMNIRQKTAAELEGLETKRIGEKEPESEPINVIVDYPEDFIISVNARIHKSEIEFTESDADVSKTEKTTEKSDAKEVESDAVNSTFVKAPYTSTLIYPIFEETEHSDIMNELNKFNSGLYPGSHKKKSFMKSGDNSSSDYQTVFGGNDTLFGNLSAIDADPERGKSRDVATGTENSGTSSNNIIKDFRNYPSLSMNSRSRFSESEKLTPVDKLVKALHVLARYRGAWGIFEDDGRIVQHLITLNNLLATTDNAIIQSTCMDEDYLELNGLICYFTIEKRFVIRCELLRTFSLLSSKSHALAAFIFASEIPVVLASEILKGDYTSKEVYEYAVNFVRMIVLGQLSENQCESIGPTFYSKVIQMIYYADKSHVTPMSEILLQAILLYHGQLRDDTELKWLTLEMAAENKPSLKKFKQKLINMLIRNATATPSTTDITLSGLWDGKIKEITVVLKDLIVCCKSTRKLFRDAELDIMLVAMIHYLEESNHELDVQIEVLNTVYQVLKIITTEPTGIDRLGRLAKHLLIEAEGAGDSNFRNIVKKINKLLHSY